MRRREDEITRTGDVDGEGRKEGRREGKLVFYLVQAAAVTGPWALGGVEIADYHLADYRSTSYCTHSEYTLYTHHNRHFIYSRHLSTHPDSLHQHPSSLITTHKLLFT